MPNFITIGVGNYNSEYTYNLYLDFDCDGNFQNPINFEGPTITINLDDYGYVLGDPPGNVWCYKVCERYVDADGNFREGCCCTENNNPPPTEPLKVAHLVRKCCGVNNIAVFVEYYPPLPSCFVSNGVAYSVGNEIPPDAPNYPNENDVLVAEQTFTTCQQAGAQLDDPCPRYYVRCIDDAPMGVLTSSPTYYYPDETGPNGDSFKIDGECYYVELGEVPENNEGEDYTLNTSPSGPEIYPNGCDECAGEIFVNLIRTCDTAEFTAKIDNLGTFDSEFGITVSAPFELDGVTYNEDTCFLVASEINETNQPDAIFDYNELAINTDNPLFPGCGCEYFMFRCGLDRDTDIPYYKVTIEDEFILYSYWLGETHGFDYLIEEGIGTQCVYLIPAIYYETEPTPQFTDIQVLNVSQVSTGGCQDSSQNITVYNCPACTGEIPTMGIRGIYAALPSDDYQGQLVQWSEPRAGFINVSNPPLNPNDPLLQQLQGATYNMDNNSDPSYVIIPKYYWTTSDTQTQNETGRIINGGSVQVKRAINEDDVIFQFKTQQYIGEFGDFDIYSINPFSAYVLENNYSTNQPLCYLNGDIGELNFNY